jgi:general secretion pathway protein D
VVKLVDHSGLEDAKIRFFELDQAPAMTVSEDLQKVLEASHVTGVTIVPLKRLNGLFVFARTTQAVDEVGRWITKLDTPSKEKTTSLWVYHPKNLSAEALANTLNGSNGGSGAAQSPMGSTISNFSGASNSGFGAGGLSNGAMSSAGNNFASNLQAPSPSAAPSYSNSSSGMGAGFLSTPEDPVHVTVDRDSNTILFSASQARWIQIQKILNEIDVAPGQIMIEASILEVTLTDQFNLGVDWSFASSTSPVTVASINSASGTVSATLPGFAATYLGKDIKASINALKSKTAVEVISAPKIVALNNHAAMLQVGDQVPVITQTGQSTSAAGAPIINSVSYENTGIILNVTPRITGDDKISLDISQEVSSVADTTTSGIDSPTIQQRMLSTTMILTNGGVAALGGLISSNKTRSESGMPFLKDAPILGQLFRHNGNTGNRTELIVLITARIMKDEASSQKVMSDLLADMKEIKSRALLAN